MAPRSASQIAAPATGHREASARRWPGSARQPPEKSGRATRRAASSRRGTGSAPASRLAGITANWPRQAHHGAARTDPGPGASGGVADERRRIGRPRAEKSGGGAVGEELGSSRIWPRIHQHGGRKNQKARARPPRGRRQWVRPPGMGQLMQQGQPQGRSCRSPARPNPAGSPGSAGRSPARPAGLLWPRPGAAGLRPRPGTSSDSYSSCDLRGRSTVLASSRRAPSQPSPKRPSWRRRPTQVGQRQPSPTSTGSSAPVDSGPGSRIGRPRPEAARDGTRHARSGQARPGDEGDDQRQGQQAERQRPGQAR